MLPRHWHLRFHSRKQLKSLEGDSNQDSPYDGGVGPVEKCLNPLTDAVCSNHGNCVGHAYMFSYTNEYAYNGLLSQLSNPTLDSSPHSLDFIFFSLNTLHASSLDSLSLFFTLNQHTGTTLFQALHTQANMLCFSLNIQLLNTLASIRCCTRPSCAMADEPAHQADFGNCRQDDPQ